MKALKFLIIHCTATPEGRHHTPEDVKKWHLSPTPTGRGWRQVGYSDMILLDGAVVNLVPYDDNQYVEPWEITNGVAGINNVSRHIVYVGGCDAAMKPKDTRTAPQRIALVHYVWDFLRKHPTVLIAGHNQFDKKACPSFSVPEWLRNISIPQKNIYIPK